LQGKLWHDLAKYVAPQLKSVEIALEPIGGSVVISADPIPISRDEWLERYGAPGAFCGFEP
jgi:hypothetical protein